MEKENMNYTKIMTTYTPIIVLIIIILAVVAIFHSTRLICSIMPDIKYIKMEINRSTTREGKKYWKRELRKLYIESLPFSSYFKFGKNKN